MLPSNKAQSTSAASSNQPWLHESLGDIPPVEFEQLHAARTNAFAGDVSVTGLAERLSGEFAGRASGSFYPIAAPKTWT
jgi:hypothetical protein